jgi:uncharacterized protein involved in exopolysaccharide biosynthesis
MKKMFGKTWKNFGMRTLFVISLSLFTFLLTDFGISKLPQTFESSSLLVFKQPIITNGVLIEHRTDEDLAQRISTLNNEVLSRSSLEPMIAKYALYNDEKAKGIPIEQIIEKMKHDIKVEPAKTDSKYKAFRIKFSCDNAKKAQQVTAELASRYVSTQIGDGVHALELTADFLERQINDAKSQLQHLKGQKLKDAKIEYQNLLNKQNDTHMCTDCSGSNDTEIIKVQDAANLPTTLNRLKLEAIGASFGFILGLMLVWLAGIIEVRKPQLR